MVKNKKDIKIVQDSNANYTFLDPIFIDNVKDENGDTVNKTMSNTEKEILKARSMDSKKSKIRHNRLVGGQNKQGHSSVYE